MSLLPYLEPVAERRNLSAEQARQAMLVILGGHASQSQLAAFLMAMRMKGETVEELVGFARAMREMAAPVEHGLVGETLLDTCGTGGDGACTFNISTIAAFVVAGAGVRVAKHGNRSITNRGGGSADLLEAMGIDIALSPADSARAIRQVGIGFLFAPHVHTAMKHANPVRLDLKMRTFFNLLGPLTNPARASAQLAGVPSERAGELISGALASLGLERGFVVHGSDGLDEITTTGPTLVFEIRDGKVERRTLEPEDFAVHRATAEDLKGGHQARNLAIATAVLEGARGPQRDIVLVNAAAALVAAGRVTTFLEGMAIGTVSIDSGAARAKVAELARFTHGLSGFMANTQTLIAQAYSAFNHRDIDSALALMSEDVSWPKASEGGRVVGKEEIRAYWTRQWQEFDPHVEPLDVIDQEGGRTAVKVHQLVKSLGGDVLSDSEVWHVYTIANGCIERMDLKESETSSDPTPSSAFSRP